MTEVERKVNILDNYMSGSINSFKAVETEIHEFETRVDKHFIEVAQSIFTTRTEIQARINTLQTSIETVHNNIKDINASLAKTNNIFAAKKGLLDVLTEYLAPWQF